MATAPTSSCARTVPKKSPRPRRTFRRSSRVCSPDAQNVLARRAHLSHTHPPPHRTSYRRPAMKLSVNGTQVDVAAAPDETLLWVLREKLKLTGTKFGCGMAQCGACTVHVDGK